MFSRSTKTVATMLAGLVAISSFGAVAPSFAASRAQCDAYARNVANHRANSGNVLAGTVLGAGAGALLGAAIGGGKTGAVVVGGVMGGAGGTIIAGSAQQNKWQRVYNRAFWNCRQNM